MILSDLTSSTVVDTHGAELGRVIDVRFVIDGAPAQLLADAQLVGLVVSPHSGSSFLGYERTDTRAPALIARFLRRRHRDSFLVLWRDLALVSPGRVTLRPGFKRWSPALDQPE
jgi:sporulation protein YlmC with PRC-barrel domain